jgi:hypothetical protein
MPSASSPRLSFAPLCDRDADAPFDGTYRTAVSRHQKVMADPYKVTSDDTNPKERCDEIDALLRDHMIIAARP